MKPEEHAPELEAELQKLYMEFVKKVAEIRRRKYDEVEPLAQGRWTSSADSTSRWS